MESDAKLSLLAVPSYFVEDQLNVGAFKDEKRAVQLQ